MPRSLRKCSRQTVAPSVCTGGLYCTRISTFRSFSACDGTDACALRCINLTASIGEKLFGCPPCFDVQSDNFEKDVSQQLLSQQDDGQ